MLCFQLYNLVIFIAQTATLHIN